MAHCTIHPIPLNVIPFEWSGMIHFAGPNRPVILAVYMWYIEGAKEKILVDSGVDTEHSERPGSSVFFSQTLDAGLNKVGITTNDIDLIIQTHLHFDHVAYASRFPNARVMVQKRELEFARNPHPTCRSLYGYDKKFFDDLKFEVIDGDFQISEDVSVLFTPGHSPGGQSVSVKTDDGTAIIAGLCTMLDNFNPTTLPNGETMLVTIPKMHTDITEAYDSMVRIKEMADIILPIHDSSFFERDIIP